MAIFNQNYDANSYITKGYDLPDKEIMGAIGARTQYFIQTAQKLKNEYDSTFDFNLTNEGNINRLRAEKEQVDNNLKSLVKKDLTIGENSFAIRKLYKPIMQDQSFLMDEAITNKVSTGLQAAQSEKAKKGSSYYNFESVKALANTLDDLRTADTSQPGWHDKFNSDTLGTTYIPYDPKVDEKFNDDMGKHLKSLKSKYTQPQIKAGPDGQPMAFYLSETEVSAVTDMEMKNWLSANRPEQQAYKSQLKGKNDLHDALKLVQQDPVAGANTTLAYLTNVRDRARVGEINVINRTINNLSAAALGVASTDSAKFEQLKSQIEGLQGKDGKGGYKKEVEDAYAKFNPKSILDNPQTGYKDLADLYDKIQINGTVEGLGLDQTTTTLKSDASATSIQMNKDRIQAQKEIAYFNAQARAALEQAKATAKAGTTAGRTNADGSFNTNPNIVASTDLGSSDVQDDGKAIVETVQSQLAVDAIDVKKQFLEGNGAVVNVNGENKNVLDYLRGSSENFNSLLEKSNLSSSTKDMIKALAGGAGTNLSGAAAANNIINSLADEKTLSNALQRASYTLSDPDGPAKFGFQLQELKNKRQAVTNKFAVPTLRAAQAAGINFKGASNDDIVDFDVTHYADNVIDDLKGAGLSYQDKQVLTNYLETGEVADLFKNPKFGRWNGVKATTDEFGRVVPITPVGTPLFNKVNEYKKVWDKFKSNREKEFLVEKNNTGYSPLSNSASFNVVSTSEDSKSFDENSMIYESQVPNLLARASTTINGVPQNPKAFAGFQAIRGKLGSKSILGGLEVVDNGDNPYVRLTLAEGAAKKLTADATQEDIENIDDFVQNASKLKFYVPRDEIKKLGFGEQSKAVLNYKNAGSYKYTLPSGNKIQFVNRAMGNDLRIEPDGNFSKISVYPDGTLSLDNLRADSSTLASLSIGGQALEQVPEKVGQGIYMFDMRASTLKNILRSNHIPTEGRIKISDLQKLKERDFINKIISLSAAHTQ